MNLTLLLTEQIISMVLICIAGFIITKLNIITSEESRVISKICVYVVIPCSLINSFQTDFDESKVSGLTIAFILAILIHATYFAAVYFLRIIKKPLALVDEASAIYNNAGNLCIPIVTGALGVEYVFYTSAYIAVQNFLMWSHGQTIMGSSEKINLKKVFLNPGIIGIFIGVTLFLLRIQITGPLGIAISNSAACLGPLSMLLIGMLLGDKDLKKIFTDTAIYKIVSIRLIAFPILSMILLLVLSKFLVHSDLSNILVVSLLCTIGPTASTITQLAQLYENKKRSYVSSVNVVSTVLCAITMPIMIVIFQALV